MAWYIHVHVHFGPRHNLMVLFIQSFVKSLNMYCWVRDPVFISDAQLSPHFRRAQCESSCDSTPMTHERALFVYTHLKNKFSLNAGQLLFNNAH